jgi:hypothetical protein
LTALDKYATGFALPAVDDADKCRQEAERLREEAEMSALELKAGSSASLSPTLKEVSQDVYNPRFCAKLQSIIDSHSRKRGCSI